MADEPVEKSASPAPGLQRRRLTTNRFSTQDLTPLGARRRSSIDSLREARRSFQDSTDDLLMPKPDLHGHEKSIESSAWDSAPLAFALLPAVGGLIFTNGSSVITDVMLLGLAAIFLNWSVRLPWYVLIALTGYHATKLTELGIGTIPRNRFERRRRSLTMNRYTPTRARMITR